MAENDFIWWKHGIVYQIYPRSFQDTNGDAVGDLAGICERLDYLVWLGIDALWISPIFPSPMADFGYDVADYCSIDPLFGSLADFDRLVHDAHVRGLKVILDFVPNHTSEQHRWFIESASSLTNPKRDWYIWRNGKPDGSPPNNWMSQFGGPAWTFDPTTGQYYLHSFLRQQPDLNWRNDNVRAAMYSVLRFWLDRGVDGFRVDVIWLLIKDTQLRDNPPNPDYAPGQPDINRLLHVYNADQPDVHQVVAQMRSVLDQYDQRVLIGEIYLPVEKLVTYYGEDLRGAQLPFNFQLIRAPWNAREIATLVDDYEKALPAGGWPNWVLGNHDQPRIAARVGAAQARIAAMLLLSLRGTPTMYYGDELGIAHVDIPSADVQDPWEKNEPGRGLNRDPSRTPFQWNDSVNAGFTSGRPWLPLDPHYRERNVDVLRDDPTSILALYHRLIALRRKHAALSIGDFQLLAVDGDVVIYERCHRDDLAIVALNFGHAPQSGITADGTAGATVQVSTHCDRTGTPFDHTLRADEGVILSVPR